MLEIRNLRVSYGKRVILDRVSLTVEAGQVLAIIGPNGAGKSTLIRAASGVIPISSGEIKVSGRSLRELSANQRARHIAPQQLLEAAHTVAADGKLRQDEHSILAFVFAEANGVVWAAHFAVVIQIAAAGAAGVYGAGKKVFEQDRLATVLSDGKVFRAKQLRSFVRVVVVEFIDQQDVWPHALDDFGNLARLLVVAGFKVFD